MRARKTEQLQIRVSPGEKAALRARAAKAGKELSAYVLEQLLPREGDAFEGVVRQLGKARGDKGFGFAAVSDLLAGCKRAGFAQAVRFDAREVLRDEELAYVASMVELAAERVGAEAPGWARAVPGLAVPWFGSELKSVRLMLLRDAPVAFRKRNIFVDASVGARV